MKLQIGGPGHAPYTTISGILREFWAFNGMHIKERRIKSSWNDVYGFWDVTVERGPLIKTGYGHGSIEYQTKRWNEYVETIVAMNSQGRLKPDLHSWTWEYVSDNIHTEEGEVSVNNQISCPAIRLFLYAGTSYGLD